MYRAVAHMFQTRAELEDRSVVGRADEQDARRDHRAAKAPPHVATSSPQRSPPERRS